MIELDDIERDFLETGLLQWGGVVAMTDALARAIGHRDAVDFYAESARCADRIAGGVGITTDAWRRCLTACEIAFASESLGLGHEWDDFSEFDPNETYQAMRRLQWKIAELG
ncbi:hypothetical protein [Gordonia sp. OPL2]|uniref:hypothetical protein n=1 Tax=Gordonia sp. OPL2 TaxID=2486274 RepID=UPI001654DD8B|nr:hypothetical protein [Gordonia sp. OPL2]